MPVHEHCTVVYSTLIVQYVRECDNCSLWANFCYLDMFFMYYASFKKGISEVGAPFFSFPCFLSIRALRKGPFALLGRYCIILQKNKRLTTGSYHYCLIKKALADMWVVVPPPLPLLPSGQTMSGGCFYLLLSLNPSLIVKEFF